MAKIDIDLPDPKPRAKLSNEDYQKHRYVLYKNLFLFAVLYGTLHKVLIPLFLSQTTVLIREYAEIDYWFIPGLVLAFVIVKKGFSKIASFMAGVLITYAAWEARAIFLGEHKGWLLWSHALSSLPQGLMALVLLTSQKQTRSVLMAWLGSGLCLLLLVVAYGFNNNKAVLDSPSHRVEINKALPNECGLHEYMVQVSELSLSKEIHIKDCGFSPLAMRFLSDADLVIKRSSVSPLNIHIIYFDVNGKRTRQSNRVVTSRGLMVPVSELKFDSKEVAAILYSDTATHLGHVVILSESHSGKFQKVGVQKNRKFFAEVRP